MRALRAVLGVVWMGSGIAAGASCGSFIDTPESSSNDGGEGSSPVADGAASTDAGVSDASDAANAADALDADASDDVIKVAVSSGHSCALISGGRVKCWGPNSVGALGLGDTVDRGTGQDGGAMGASLPFVDLGAGRRAIDIAVGAQDASGSPDTLGASCALLDDGAIKCWGYNGYGQLGRGNTLPIGAGPNQMGDALSPVFIGSDIHATAIGMGRYHVCALLDDQRVKCWGHNTYGQLGIEGDHRGRYPAEMGDQLPPVPLSARATAIAVGGYHSCALLEGGTVTCWGHNAFGQLGTGDRIHRGLTDAGLVAVPLAKTATAIAAGGFGTCAILTDGSLKCWGINSVGQLGLGDTIDRGAGADGGGAMADLPSVELGTGRSAKAISLGTWTTCVLLDDGHVKCWGLATRGRLGSGDAVNRGDQPNEMGDSLPTLVKLNEVTSLAAGDLHACVVMEGGVKCFGANDRGRLGLGDLVDRGDKPGDMGGLPFVDLGLLSR